LQKVQKDKENNLLWLVETGHWRAGCCLLVVDRWLIAGTWTAEGFSDLGILIFSGSVLLTCVKD